MDENILNPPINLTEEEKIVWDVTYRKNFNRFKVDSKSEKAKVVINYGKQRIKNRIYRCQFLTAITNEFTKIQNVAKEELGFKNFYNKAPSLFNARAIEFFYEYLAKMGVEEVFYYSIRDKFLKHYGYFIKN